MTSQRTLELKGSLRAHPAGELIIEVSQAELSGSLRLSCGEKKSVLYFGDGRLVYGVSNAKALRLFNILLDLGTIEQKTLAQFPNFANDVEFVAALKAKGVLDERDLEVGCVKQIESVLADAVSWPDGEWEFSPLARIRQDLNYRIDANPVLVDHARSVAGNIVNERFKREDGVFVAAPARKTGLQLHPHEDSMLSSFGTAELTIDELRELCKLPEAGLLRTLYVLWLGGFLVREKWQSAISAEKLDEIRTTRVSLVRGTSNPEPQKTVPEEKIVEPTIAAHALDKPLDEYLTQVEKAETFYSVLDVGETAAVSDIKSRYFALAKLFHPDRYHREAPEQLRRVQLAFTKIAHAYEILKDPESRSTYDFKMRKEAEARSKSAGNGKPSTGPANMADMGERSFHLGLSHFEDGDHKAAAGFFGRAVHYEPQNAMYHCYYGRALAADDRQRHKAESEIQTAVRLEPKNAEIRLTLARFFIEMNMVKRAQGELQRFLEIVPDNMEAANLLNSIGT